MKIKKMILVVIAVIAVIVIFLTLNAFIVKAYVPEVKEGRFEFCVTYEIKGELKTYSGVYICKFNGVEKSIYGSSLKWESYVEGLDDSTSILLDTNDEGNIYLEFALYASHFMNDPEYVDWDAPKPYLCLVYHSDDPDLSSSTTDIDFLNLYGIQIINFDYPEPIENNYKEKLSFATWDFSIN